MTSHTGKRALAPVVVGGQSLHIVGLGEAMDDVIGPMMIKAVRFRARGTRASIRSAIAG